ncbi:Serine/threonine-protein phosphatase 5 [Camellia lanceoleosa]|uniref:Serine/threonine-protein phosphatase 5 n=1 Tax=Camellia lanceoleosa TaxID=1840588 RepID=A0ACC0G7Q8_9ERIC|nr:Serine/threonine-protein phosphatase 5 [Camellia lanceoleosa]
MGSRIAQRSKPETIPGLMCALLWSDLQPDWKGPNKRGVGLSFGADVTKRFSEKTIWDEGYEIEHDGKLILMGNKGAFIRFEAPNLKPNIVTFSAVDEKLQDVLGHFQKDFEGGVSAENLRKYDQIFVDSEMLRTLSKGINRIITSLKDPDIELVLSAMEFLRCLLVLHH